MKIGKLAALAALSVASVGVSAPVLSAPVSVDIRIAPPAPRDEIIPVAGSWVAERPGYYYNSPTWVQQGDRWVLTRGSWERGERDRNAAWRDRDHDGIPNRYDRDRDNDGVPNNRDRRPDNPHRY